MWTWLFPYFIPIACFVGNHGTIQTAQAGPYWSALDAEVMAMYLRYEAGCETGEIVRHNRWSSAVPIQPLHPRYWENIKLTVAPDTNELTLVWREP